MNKPAAPALPRRHIPAGLYRDTPSWHPQSQLPLMWQNEVDSRAKTNIGFGRAIVLLIILVSALFLFGLASQLIRVLF